MNAVRNNFGIGLGGEFVAQLEQFVAQLFVIFNDAVMHDRQTVIGNVRMRIALARHTVGGPACVRNANFARGRRFGECVLQHFDLADGPDSFQLVGAVEDREPSGVVATIFKAAQPFHQNRNDIALSNGADNSAHTLGPWSPPGSGRYFAPLARLERDFT